MKYSINDTTLTAIGDAIREKNGSSESYTPGAMADAILAIQGGGGDIEIEPIVLTGSQSYGCSGKIAGNFCTLFPNVVSTSGLRDMDYMFSNYSGEKIPFDLNCSNSSYYNMTSLFRDANIKTVPKVLNAYPSGTAYMFYGCRKLREIPEGWTSTWNWDRMHTYQYANTGAMFQMCYSLRKIDQNLIDNCFDNYNSSWSSWYNSMFYDCAVLDEISNLPINDIAYTSNQMSNLVTNCMRLKKFTFATNEDGTPKTAQWQKQTLQLRSVGWASYAYTNRMYSYNSGITADKQVCDDATYAALKDDPDWFAGATALQNDSYIRQYSRYNKESLMETIDSLPDCSAVTTDSTMNYVYVYSNQGALTDGGACGDLAQEYIDKAAAKGWKVVFS